MCMRTEVTMKQATSRTVVALAAIIIFEAIVINFILIAADDSHYYETGESQLILTRSIARQIETHVAGTYDKLITISNVPEIRESNTEQCNDKLQELYAQFKLVPSAISRTGKDYVRDCSTIRSVIGSNVGEYEYAQKIFNDPLHASVMGRALPSIIYKDRYFIPVVVPIFDENKKFSGTIGSAVYLDELKEKYFGTGLAENMRAVIIDDDDIILYHPNKELIGKNIYSDVVADFVGDSIAFDKLKNGVSAGLSGVTIVDINGTKHIESYAPASVFAGRRWTVVVTTSVNTTTLNEHGKDMRNLIYTLVLLLNAFFTLILVAHFQWHSKKQKLF